MTASSVVIEAARAEPVYLRLRWSPYLVLLDASNRPTGPGCLADADGWTVVTVPGPGTYRVAARFDLVTATLGCQPGAG